MDWRELNKDITNLRRKSPQPCDECRQSVGLIWSGVEWQCLACGAERYTGWRSNPQRIIVAQAKHQSQLYEVIQCWSYVRVNFQSAKLYELCITPFFERPHACLGVSQTLKEAKERAENWAATFARHAEASATRSEVR